MRQHKIVICAALAAVVLTACASSSSQQEESTQQFSENKQKVIEQEQREAEERRERQRAMREQQEQVDGQLDDAVAAPRAPRKTIPEAELPELTACDEPGNVTACGQMSSPDGEVRVTASMVPAVMTKGQGQMQIGAVRKETQRQVESLLPCYGWAHLNEDAESTEYDIEIAVKVDGEVAGARVNPTDGPVGAAGCMEQRIEQQWSMPVPSGGGTTIIATITFAAK
jgi:glucose/arabinose dehydrogenase